LADPGAGPAVPEVFVTEPDGRMPRQGAGTVDSEAGTADSGVGTAGPEVGTVAPGFGPARPARLPEELGAAFA
jgi:hypothetical protein